MTETIEPAVSAYLVMKLGWSYPNLPFVEAVVLHLGSGPTALWTQFEAAVRVVELLASEEAEQEADSRLAAEPEIVASFFQNADLLDRSAPESAAFAHLVMIAIGSMRDAAP